VVKRERLYIGWESGWVSETKRVGNEDALLTLCPSDLKTW
jgi:hypothetical protein